MHIGCSRLFIVAIRYKDQSILSTAFMVTSLPLEQRNAENISIWWRHRECLKIDYITATKQAKQNRLQITKAKTM